MWKELELIMLESIEKTELLKFKNYLSDMPDSWYKITYGEGIPQKLYAVSNEVIKLNDFVFDKNTNKVYKAGNVEHCNYFEHIKKIIAVAYDELPHFNSGRVGYNIPKFRKEFIENYIKEYNKGNIITKVMVEYEERMVGKTKQTIKINPDNTINIKVVEQKKYTPSELKYIVKNCVFAAKNDDSFDIDKWIDENF